MIKSEQVPKEAMEAAAVQLSNGKTTAEAIAAALNAWPGVRMMVDIDTGDDAAIKLPLPQEK